MDHKLKITHTVCAIHILLCLIERENGNFYKLTDTVSPSSSALDDHPAHPPPIARYMKKIYQW